MVTKPLEYTSIDSICRLVRGSSPRPKGDPRYYDGPIPRLMVQDLTRDGKLVTPQIDSLTEEGAKLSRFAPAGTVVMVVSGQVGQVGRLVIDACIHDGFVGFLDLDTGRVDPDYFMYALESQQHQHDRNMSGAIWKNLTTKQVKAMQIPLPPLAEQQRIAAILDQADVLRTKRRAALAKLDTLLQATFLHMFGDPVTNPMGWEVKRIQDFCNLVRGSSPRPKSDPRYYNGPVPRLMVADLTRDGFFVTPRIDSLTEKGAKQSRFVSSQFFVVDQIQIRI